MSHLISEEGRKYLDSILPEFKFGYLILVGYTIENNLHRDYEVLRQHEVDLVSEEIATFLIKNKFADGTVKNPIINANGMKLAESGCLQFYEEKTEQNFHLPVSAPAAAHKPSAKRNSVMGWLKRIFRM